MTTTTNQHQKYGILLEAVSLIMIGRSVSASAARSGSFDATMKSYITKEYGLPEDEIDALLLVDLSEAINAQ